MLALAPLLLVLAGCTAPPSAEPSVAPTPVGAAEVEPQPIPTPGPIEPTTVLVVTATATATDGEQLALELRVVQSTAFDDIGSQTLPAGVLQDCAGLYTEAQFAQGSWSFTRANLYAIPTDASTADWPVESRISVLPSAASAPMAGRGILAIQEADAATPLCEQEKTFAGYGSGGLAFGIPGDSGTFTAWAGHAYGFTAPAGVTLTECAAQTTELGSTLGGDDPAWTTVVDASTCAIGTLPETAEY